jgi:hypothetical protein
MFRRALGGPLGGPLGSPMGNASPCLLMRGLTGIRASGILRFCFYPNVPVKRLQLVFLKQAHMVFDNNANFYQFFH